MLIDSRHVFRHALVSFANQKKGRTKIYSCQIQDDW